MSKLTTLTLLVSILLVTSCAPMQNNSINMRDYYSKAPDLTNVTYKGGDGKTLETSIIIKNAGNERNGIAAEYDYIAKKHGVKFTNWKPVGTMSQSKNEKKFDIITIVTLPKNETIIYCFDITDFYGKF